MSNFRLTVVLVLLMCSVSIARTNTALPGPLSRPHTPGMIALAAITSSPAPAHVKAWWSDRFAGYAGGILGGAMGLEGAVIGILGSRGRYPRLTFILMLAAVAVGVVLLIAGVIAACLHQPYGVYYPLLLGGFLNAVIYGNIIRVFRRIRRQIELRKIHAMDAS
jgi:hypothetical protein